MELNEDTNEDTKKEIERILTEGESADIVFRRLDGSSICSGGFTIGYVVYYNGTDVFEDDIVQVGMKGEVMRSCDKIGVVEVQFPNAVFLDVCWNEISRTDPKLCLDESSAGCSPYFLDLADLCSGNSKRQ